MMNMEKLLNELKTAELEAPCVEDFEQYLVDIDDKSVWKYRKQDSIVNEFYAKKYEVWNDRLILRTFYVVQKWFNKEKQYCNIYEVQRFLAGSNMKINKWIYSASFGGVRPKYWENYNDCQWEENNIHSMVCTEFYTYNRSIYCYRLNLYENLIKESVHKYCAFEYTGLSEEELFWYLYQYEKHPQLEMIAKMGLMDIVKGNMNCIRWSQKGYKALGLENKKDVKLVKLCGKFGGLKYYRKHATDIKKFDIQTTKELEIYDTLFHRNYPDISKKLIKYLNDVNDLRTYGIALDYIDYIESCEKLGIVLTSKVRYPEDLKASHDEVMGKLQIIHTQKETKAIQKQVNEKLYKYRYANNSFIITPANSSEDLIQESKELSHCVRTYVDLYAKGKTSIMLIRKREDVNKPFYTLELKENKVIQVRGKHNCDPTDDVTDFVKDWARFAKVKYMYS